VLGFEELAGFAQSNRPARRRASRPAEVVLVADGFPARGDPLVDFARTLDEVRVEAAGRPQAPWTEVTRELDVTYREDDGVAARTLSLGWLVLRHPLRCAGDRRRRRGDEPSLWSLAPSARRLELTRGARVHALGGEGAQSVASRLARLIGRSIE
jgi:hypothetical protein